jgi:hypothetical protein
MPQRAGEGSGAHQKPKSTTYETMSSLATRHFQKFTLVSQLPRHCAVVENANHIFGPDLANLRGKMIRTKPEHVRIEYVQIP